LETAESQATKNGLLGERRTPQLHRMLEPKNCQVCRHHAGRRHFQQHEQLAKKSKSAVPIVKGQKREAPPAEHGAPLKVVEYFNFCESLLLLINRLVIDGML
jgi:hypothetical protein